MPPDDTFTFRRVKPPSAGQKRLINIQITPPPPEVAILPHNLDIEMPKDLLQTVPAPIAVTGDSDWFWSVISPEISAASSLRMETAVAALRLRPGAGNAGAGMRDQVARIRDKYGTDILLASAGSQVSPALVLAVIAVESGGEPAAVSSAGAAGLMQLMPATATRFGVTDRADAEQNIAGGVKYLNWLLGEFGNDPVLALAAYNAGEGAVQRAGGVPEYAETRNYIPKVLDAWTAARLMCLTPPRRATDGCIFTGLRLASE